MVRFYFTTLSIPISSSNLCLVYLLSNIPHGMTDSFSIHLFILQYKSFLVINFITKLNRNLLTLRLVVFDFAKELANT